MQAILIKILSILLAVLAPFLSFFVQYADDPQKQDETALAEQVGGFMKGVCHPGRDYDLMKGASIGWIREDVPFPFNPDGSVSDNYRSSVDELREYKEQGFNVLVCTAKPDEYIANGLDFRRAEDREAICDVARFYAQDLQGLAGAIQIANEIGVDRFTLPLTVQEGADFIGMQARAMAPVKGDILVGYNLGGMGFLDLPSKMKKYDDAIDFVGVDLYLGSFEPVTKTLSENIFVLRSFRSMTKKPLILTEFGYIGGGTIKTEKEKLEILKKYGFDSIEAAKNDISTFIDRLPEQLRWDITEKTDTQDGASLANLVFGGEYSAHIFCEMRADNALWGYPHSEEGQARFFADLIPQISELDYVIGAFIYCWADSSTCYVCGQEDCPVETRWGLVHTDGTPKLSYYAVQKAFGDIG